MNIAVIDLVLLTVAVEVGVECRLEEPYFISVGIKHRKAMAMS